jgi:hypothetical protein
MRNIFDQYRHPENRLTHALVCVLNEDRQLLAKFLQDLLDINTSAKLIIEEQKLPDRDEMDTSAASLPDAILYDEEGSFAIMFENKISAPLKQDQLDRHIRNLKGKYAKLYPVVISLTVNKYIAKTWRQLTWERIYQWLSRQSSKSHWANTLLEFFEIVEQRLMSNEYLDGSLTTFSGIPFGEEHPHSYLEAKQVLRQLRDKLLKNKRLLQWLDVSVLPLGKQKSNASWDIISFKKPKELPFNRAPHLNFSISDWSAGALLILPNQIEAQYRARIRNMQFLDFKEAVSHFFTNFSSTFKSDDGIKPVILILQRHYKSIGSQPLTDGDMKFELRTAFPTSAKGGIKSCSEWLHAAHKLLQEQVKSGSANFSFEIGSVFLYDECKKLRSERADDLFVSAWKALDPFIKAIGL